MGWKKNSHSDSCLINITDLTVMIFWQKRENPTVHILFSFLHVQLSHTANCQTLWENTSNFKCTKKKAPASQKPIVRISSWVKFWRDSWSSCCLSHYEWIPSLRQMSETRRGKTAASRRSAQPPPRLLLPAHVEAWRKVWPSFLFTLKTTRISFTNRNMHPRDYSLASA